MAHPANVALILTEIDADIDTICASLLHDVLEDTLLGKGLLRYEFGEEVAKIVEGATKLGKLSFTSKRERQAENFRKMFVAIATDVRVVLVKLADRLHNMWTLESMPMDKQVAIARETRDIFAPLANRFGLGRFKWQLEDLSFKYLEPENYRRIEQLVDENRDDREAYLRRASDQIREVLSQEGIEGAEVVGRAKHFYSIHRKLSKHGQDRLFDLLAVRIIVDSERQCYEALGVVHDRFRPLPGRFKDYVALPKSNGYQSLHTAVIGPEEKVIEIQIRTREMHRTAEFGLAAHWKYKEMNAPGQGMSKDEDFKLNYLRHKLLELQEELPDAGDYSDAVQIDIFADEIFVFSPKGDVYSLPKGSKPLDFAYHVHTEVGNHCIGAKVNDRMVSFEYELNNGDIVEIQTSRNAHPAGDWLNYVRSSSARSKIKQWFKKNRKEESAELGYSALAETMTKARLEELIKSGELVKIANKLGLQREDDLFVKIAFGEVSPSQILGRLDSRKDKDKGKEIPALPSKQPPKATASRKRTRQTLLHSQAKCCQPLPGEDIVGVVSRGRGVVIHRSDCKNLNNIDSKRVIEMDWSSIGGGGELTVSTLEVECIDRVGVSRDVLDKVANAKVNVLDVRVMTRPTRQTALLRLSVEVNDIDSLRSLMTAIDKMSDVLVVRRYATSPSSSAK